MSVSLKGDVRIVSQQWRDAEVRAAVDGGRKAISLEAGRAILDDANKHVPFEKGTLHDSGRVEEVSRTGTTTAVISYSTPYARRLHEHPEYNFQNGREGKWLERALDRAPREVLALMGEGWRRVFRRA